jgi:hypothetical protein
MKFLMLIPIYTLFVSCSHFIKESNTKRVRNIAKTFTLNGKETKRNFCFQAETANSIENQEQASLCVLLLHSLQMFSDNDILVDISTSNQAIQFVIQMPGDDIQFLQKNNGIRIQAIKTLINEAYISLQIGKDKTSNDLEYEKLKVAILRFSTLSS